jgi:mono/diheme cytochrome c family protein
MKRAWLFLAMCALASAADIDFTRDVHPILAEHCFACHGGDKRSGGLSLRDHGEALKGGRSGPAILPGRSADSLILKRVSATTSPMPPAGPRLNAAEIAIIRSWIDGGARETAQGPDARTPWIAKIELHKPDIPPGTSQNPVDRFVNAYLRGHRLAIQPAVSDRLFARRAYLDIWGLLPSPEQLAAFVNSSDTAKRNHLVETLLTDNRNYAEHWISFWNDLLRNDEGVNYAGTRKSITPWLYQALSGNMRYDRFVSKLLDPAQRGDPDGFLLGVNWRGDINASQTPLMQAAQNSAQVFLGINLKCNSCHDSFIGKWKLKDAYALAAFFADDEQLELVRCDNKTGQFTSAKFLYSELATPQPLNTPSERKAAVAHLFTEARNGRMPRTIVNRVWARLLGRGLVADVDDMDSEPWSPELLDWLAADFVEHNYDLKHLIATIMTSRAYQLPAVHRSAKEIKDYVFQGPEVRRMTAEEFADALSAVTGEWPVYVPPQSTRGVYSRQWRMPSSPVTRGLGRPIRDQVYTERDQDATTLQELELVNGETLRHNLARGAKHLLDQLPPAPPNLFDSGRVTSKPVAVDIDIGGVRELRLLTTDQGSYSPERALPAWMDAVLIGPNGETPLSSLQPKSGQFAKAPVTLGEHTHVDAMRTTLPSELIYDVAGHAYARLRATVGLDNACRKDDISPGVRFFVFKDKPDPERLVRLDPSTPVPPLPRIFAKEQLVSTLFQYMLGRTPTAEERRLAATTLAAGGVKIKAEGLADLLWAIAMQPEFQLIY